MTAIRTLAFTVAFYLWSLVLSILMLPLLVCPWRWTMAMFRFWGRSIFLLLAVFAGVKVEVRGREHLPKGAALVAAKHQCMFDVFAQFVWLDDSCWVMRKELMRIPFFNLYAWKVRMIVLDREGGSNALRKLVRDARERVAEAPRPVAIFPEGTRGKPGVAGTYQPGVAGLYRDLELPCHPVATNSGVHWPMPGKNRPPGAIVFEYLRRSQPA
jgi:1-acyl-sn-glycerol-3-phosphate acyltransferase